MTDTDRYKGLLTITATKPANEGYLKHKDIPEIVEDKLQHEIEHLKLLLEHKDIIVKLGIRFVEYRGRSIVGFYPFIYISRITAGFLRNAFNTPLKKSVVDKFATQ